MISILVADAENTQGAVAVLVNLVGAFADQHVDDMHGAKALTGAIYRRQNLLCSLGTVEHFRRRQAHVTITAVLIQRVVKVRQQGPAPAAGDLAPAQQGIEFHPFAAFMRFIRGGRIDHLPKTHDVLQPVYHPCSGRFTIATRATGFLVVRFQALWQVQMGDEAYVRLVDAQAECNGGDNDHAIVIQEPMLVLGPGGRVETRVIGKRVESLANQPGRRGFRFLARHAVNDTRIAVVGRQESEQLTLRIELVLHQVADVGPVEAGNELRRVRKFQSLDNINPSFFRRGRGQRHPRHTGKMSSQFAERQIVLAKIVPPLRNAVCFIDGDERYPAGL